MSIELGNLITYNPLTVQVEDSLESILELLPGFPFHHWPVVDDDRRLVGVLSEQDISSAFSQRMALSAIGGAASTEPRPVRVNQVMSREVITINESTPVAAALSLMLRRGIHCLPVLNNRRLVAILTSTDLLREFSFGELAISRETVNDHLVNCLDFLNSDATLGEAQSMLDSEQVDCVPVMQGGCPLGLVTRRQLYKTLLRQNTAPLTSVAKGEGEWNGVMDSVLECVLPIEPLRPGQKLSSAATTMVEHGAQAVAVVNQAKRFLGVITEEHLLRLMFAALERK